MQRAKTDKLSRTSLRPSTINRLPTEILVFIFDLVLDAHYSKRILASVCRRWRDVVLQTPFFWSTIQVASNVSWINTHVERSRGTLLDVVIEGAPFSPSKHLELIPGLDAVVSCAHRWRSLLVTASLWFSDDDPEGEDEELLTEFIADRINHLHFPSLKSVAISPPCEIGHLNFLSVACAPALEHLELDDFTAVDHIPNPVAMLKTLKLNFETERVIFREQYWRTVPTQALIKLSLSGDTESPLPQPNSLDCPSLVSLEIDNATYLRPILDAIVAPNLEQVNCSNCEHAPSVTLSGSRSKFTNVRQLSFSCRRELFHEDSMGFCEAFPGVHVELDGVDLPYIFEPPSIQFQHGHNSDPLYPMDLWTELKSLTFNGLHSNWLRDDWLVDWLDH